MLVTGLPPHVDDLSIDKIIPSDTKVTLVITARASTVACPHSHYLRTLHDLPIDPNRRTLDVRARRFRHVNTGCCRKIFAEPFPRLAKDRARRTHGRQEALEEIGVALGGAVGAKLAKRVRLSASF